MGISSSQFVWTQTECATTFWMMLCGCGTEYKYCGLRIAFFAFDIFVAAAAVVAAFSCVLFPLPRADGRQASTIPRMTWQLEVGKQETRSNQQAATAPHGAITTRIAQSARSIVSRVATRRRLSMLLVAPRQHGRSKSSKSSITRHHTAE